MIVLSYVKVSKLVVTSGRRAPTNAIKKTDKHKASEIKFNFRPLGYSIPSPLVITLFNSACASLADMTFFKLFDRTFSRSWVDEVWGGEDEACASASWRDAFSLMLGD